MKKNYYEMLELENTASQKQIKKKYLKLAKLYHPDVNHSEDAEVKFNLIKEAYEILSNEETKEKYDRFLKNSEENWKTNTQKIISPENMIDYFFSLDKAKPYFFYYNEIQTHLRDITTWTIAFSYFWKLVWTLNKKSWKIISNKSLVIIFKAFLNSNIAKEIIIEAQKEIQDNNDFKKTNLEFNKKLVKISNSVSNNDLFSDKGKNWVILTIKQNSEIISLIQPDICLMQAAQIITVFSKFELVETTNNNFFTEVTTMLAENKFLISLKRNFLKLFFKIKSFSKKVFAKIKDFIEKQFKNKT